MEYKDLINQVVEDCINELYPAHNTKNLTALVRRQHKKDEEKYRKIDPEHQSKEEVQKGLQDCTTEFKTRMYAEKHKIPLNCSFKDKLNYIKEMVNSCTFMTPPIQVVGKDHPAKENLKKQEKKKKEDKCQEQ